MQPPTSSQLTLGVTLDDNATFANFLSAPRNEQALACLADNASSEQFITLWGKHDAGLTHLLQAACHQCAENQRSALYLPMEDRAHLRPEILQGTNTLSLVAIDNIELLAGDAAWEAALFTAFNAIKDSHTRLLLAAHCAPGALAIALPDLRSRIQSCLVFQIAELDDTEKRQALQLRARNRGLELGDPVADYILQRAERSLKGLMAILERLDAVSLAEQRRLTIPLVKAALGW